jgi:hypothetical protein
MRHREIVRLGLLCTQQAQRLDLVAPVAGDVDRSNFLMP